jgi:hypothetical protein
VTSDSQEQIRTFRKKYGVPFTMLSDQMLLSADALDVPISSKKGYYATLAIHPVLRHLPKKAFLQPAFFVWKGSDVVYEWRQVEKLRNLYGANGRPSPAQILDDTRKAIA